MPLVGVENLNRALREFTRDRVPREYVAVHRKVVLQVLRGVVKRTPVDTGRARGNWQVTVDAPAIGEIDADRSRAGAAGRAAEAIAQIRPFSVAWISNNVPYIRVLDEGGFVPSDPGPSKDPRRGRRGRILVSGGYSVQAPRGMVDLTIDEVVQQLGR